MTHRGHVKNGVVVLDPPADLPEGAEVEVRLVERAAAAAAAAAATAAAAAAAEGPTFYEQLQDVIGIAEGLPPDLAENHDHYIHGRPKKT